MNNLDIVCSDPPTSIQTIKFTWDLGREETDIYFCFAHQVIKIVNISVLDIHLLCGYRFISTLSTTHLIVET